MNKDKLKKFLISYIYNIPIENIKNIHENSNEFIFYDEEEEINYSIGKKQVYEYLDKISQINNKAKLNKRIAIIIESDVLFHAKSLQYKKYLMFINYVRLLNENNVGVDIITDRNVIFVCRDELLDLDVKIFFYCEKIPTENDSLEELLLSTINEYSYQNPATIKYIADTLNTCKTLMKSHIHNDLKLALVHAQDVLDFPNSLAIKDNSDYVLEFLTFLKDVDFDVLTTSIESYNSLKHFVNNKNKLHYVPENYFDINDELFYLFGMENTQIHNREVLFVYTNMEDLSSITDSVMPLGYDLTILIDKNVDTKQINDELKLEKVFSNYRIIDISFRNIVQNSYRFMVDFREKIDYNYNNYNNKFIFSDSIQDKKESDTVRYVEKNNVIEILKAMLEMDEENMFNDNEEYKPVALSSTLDTNKEIKKFYLSEI